jgi:hypothetical protein
MLVERFDMIACGENYHLDTFPELLWSLFEQPAMYFLPGKIGWDAWLNMTPQEHWQWIQAGTREATEIEVIECIHRVQMRISMHWVNISRLWTLTGSIRNFSHSSGRIMKQITARKYLRFWQSNSGWLIKKSASCKR